MSNQPRLMSETELKHWNSLPLKKRKKLGRQRVVQLYYLQQLEEELHRLQRESGKRVRELRDAGGAPSSLHEEGEALMGEDMTPEHTKRICKELKELEKKVGEFQEKVREMKENPPQIRSAKMLGKADREELALQETKKIRKKREEERARREMGKILAKQEAARRKAEAERLQLQLEEQRRLEERVIQEVEQEDKKKKRGRRRIVINKNQE